jgi:predicted LPLAT superfamily acyltransferase
VLSLMRSDVRLTVLVHTKHAKAFNDMLASLNPASKINLMQVTEINAATAMLLAAKVEQGEFIVIAGDRVPVSAKPRVAIADFLGQPAAFPVGPFILASILQCPIFLLFSMQREDHYEVHVEFLRESAHLPRKERDQALAVLVAEFAARLQYHCLRAPYQWFNFFDFWHLPTLETSDAPR